MTHQIPCLHCGQPHSITDEQIGTKVRCASPACGKMFIASTEYRVKREAPKARFAPQWWLVPIGVMLLVSSLVPSDAGGDARMICGWICIATSVIVDAIGAAADRFKGP